MTPSTAHPVRRRPAPGLARRLTAALAGVLLPLVALTTGLTTLTALTAGPLAAPAHANPASIPGDFTGYGFDQCQAPTQEAMNAWWTYSPYTAVGIYISGNSRACRTQLNLNATWVATQIATGWRLLPIALGPQASCQPRFPRYTDDPKIDATPGDGTYPNARAMGAAEAVKNATDAAALGIAPGSTIWYDLEGFDLTDTACRESALAFMSAWTDGTRAAGYVAGMYSSAGSGIKMLDDARLQRPGQFSLPDRIWIARWDGQANTSTTYIAEDGWRPGGRMKQYVGGHNETYGGVTINIDSNWIELGATPSAAAESWCGGTSVNFTTYPRLKPIDPRTPKSATPTTTVAAVKALQCLLKSNGTYRGRISGRFNPRTATATATWRAAVGFTPSTAWTRKHWIGLLSAGTTPLLKVGMTGPDVYRLQRSLVASGATTLPVTGVFDVATESAVKGYAAKVAASATGTVTPDVWTALQVGKR